MRSNSKQTKRPLALDTQTIRTLDLASLAKVGGASGGAWCYRISVGLCD